MIRVHLIPYFFIRIKKRLTRVTILIRSIVALALGRTSVRCFRRYIAIRLGHGIHVKGKGIFFIKQLLTQW